MSELCRTDSSSVPLNGSGSCGSVDELEQLVLGALEEVKTTGGGKEIANKNSPFKPGSAQVRSAETSSGKTNVNLNASLTTEHTTSGGIRVSFSRPTSDTDLAQETAENIQDMPEASLPLVAVEIPMVGSEYVYINRYLSDEQSDDHVSEVTNRDENILNEASLEQNQSDNFDYRLETKDDTSVSPASPPVESFWGSGDEEELDTQLLAEQLTRELKKYSIPQAVFARKVLNRSQGTLSDILRKPKPWQELKGGKEIFKRMKKWLELPAVKKIPQLRAEAAKALDLKSSRQSLNTDYPPAKRQRLHFTVAQKKALYEIFKETRKPSREMQSALAEELGLEKSTVSNFFMNARRRHPDV